ncbi:MAG: hypothetical protein ACOY94_20760 [Bacillota bacterium]
MIHQVKLHAETRDRLMRAVRVQLGLLLYAASLQGATLERGTCRAFMDRRPGLHGGGSDVVSWLWRSPALLAKLQAFRDDPAPQSEKLSLARKLYSDALRLSASQPWGRLQRIDKRVSWQTRAAEYLEHFYDMLSPDRHVSQEIAGRRFDRQQLIANFLDQNRGLYVCAFCEESHFYSRKSNTDVSTILDHFFPKGLYPHLCIHPYNLVPICHSCNTGVKRVGDPMEARANEPSRRLHRMVLPYRTTQLSQETYLQADLDMRAIGAIKPRRATREVLDAIALLDDVFDLPGRWQNSNVAIYQQLFRRLRGFLGASDFFSDGEFQAARVLDRLDQMVGSLYKVDMRRDPYAYVITWWLAAMAREEIEPYLTNPNRAPNQLPTLVKVLEKWQEQDAAAAAHLRGVGRDLRAVLARR